MNKELIQELMTKASELEAKGMHREADAIHERILVANNADNWQNFLNNAGEVAQWGLNPLGKGFETVKNRADPMFAGLHDNTGAFQDALVAFFTDVENSNLSGVYKQAIGSQISQAIQNSQQMNVEYFQQHHADWGKTNAPVAPQTSVVPQTPAPTQQELLKQFHASNGKFRRVEAQNQAPSVDTARSLLSKLTAIQNKFQGIIQTNAPGFQATLSSVKQAIEALSILAQQEPEAAASQAQSGAELINQIQIAQRDPAIQAAIKSYIVYGIKFGQDKMFAMLDANAQGQDVNVFRMILKDAWKPEYQAAWEQAYAKNHPQPIPDWLKNQQNQMQQMFQPQQQSYGPPAPQMPQFNAPAGLDQLLNQRR